jgi:hypothetical protein
MNMSKRFVSNWVRTILVGLAILGVDGWFARPLDAQQVPAEVRELADSWLMQNCDVGEERQLENELKQLTTQLESVFIQAFREGPDENLLKELEDVAVKRFEYRREMLETGEGLGLSEDDLRVARDQDRAQHLDRQREDFVMRYRSQALSGLGIVGGEKAREILQGIVDDEDSPLQGSARLALEKLQVAPE